MYKQHFGLVQQPFSLTPNTRYFVKLPNHQLIFTQLVEALDKPGAFIKITGEVGTGKTMLCRKVLTTLDQHRSRFVTAYIPHPILSEEGIMTAIAEELHLPISPKASYFDLIKQISAELVRLREDGKKTILFIDEAQAMPEETLAAVQLLTRMDTETSKFLQVILFAQPELDTLLERPNLRQMQKQIAYSFVLTALDRAATEAYVVYRMKKAGYHGQNAFSQPALNLLFNASKGVPRLVNILAHKALLVAFGKGDHNITEAHVNRAIEDTEVLRQNPALTQRLFSNTP